MRIFFYAILCCLCVNCIAQTKPLAIIPEPVKTELQQGNFTLNNQTVFIVKDKELGKSVDFFNTYLQKYYGFSIPAISSNTSQKNSIVLSVKKYITTSQQPEGYHLEVSDNSITIQGNSYAGVFYGIQTLIQLLPAQALDNMAIPCVTIEDYPRFAYRGLHLDVARHFFPVSFVKEYIDFIALHKMNTFHWHLTDDQGWRIEIKQYPKLTEIGSCRNGTIIGKWPGTGNDSIRYCGYYTQDEIRDVVQYAADRYITVIPEIEMPGHSSAAIAAYPQLSCFPDEPTEVDEKTPWSGPVKGKEVQQTWGIFKDVYCPGENTFTFLENVLNEVIQLFPSHYIHIGGDECPKDYWKRSDFCQQLIKEKRLKNEHELQSYFITRIEKYLNSKGRDIIGWDEILEGGLAPNATVMSWRGEQGGIDAAKQHHKVIMTPGEYVYLDHAQKKNEDSVTIGGYVPLKKVYGYEPIPKQLTANEAKYILGAQANLWTEYISNTDKAEYMLFPRLSALSEVLWTPKEEKNWNFFSEKLQTQFNRYNLWKVNYFKNALSEE